MKKVIFCLVILVFTFNKTNAGWGHHVHINYVKEAISILPYFEYQMALYYKDDILKGAIEGEIQHKYNYKGITPKWMGEISKEESLFLCGIYVDENNKDVASKFFYQRIENLKKDLNSCNRKYSDVLFELGYLICSINNILVPLYEEGHFNEHYYASNTSQAIELKTDSIEKISDIKLWMEKMIDQKLQTRKKWSAFAENNDNSGFVNYGHQANKQNIYVSASIINYVLVGCYGPSEETGHRDFVEKKHNKKYSIKGDRRPVD